MKNQEIESLIAALLAAIQKHEKQVTEADNKLIIKGLNVSLEELVESGNAQNKVIKLNNAMVDKIDELEKRLKTAEENIEVLESDINKHLN
jgi:hypothetical protein